MLIGKARRGIGIMRLNRGDHKVMLPRRGFGPNRLIIKENDPNEAIELGDQIMCDRRQPLVA